MIRIAGLLAAAALAALPAPAGAATSGSGTLTITVTPGQAISVTVNPVTLTFAEDVNTPGVGWTFATGSAWFPAGWGSAYTYSGGAGACLAITVNTSDANWGLTASFTTAPLANTTNVALAKTTLSGSTCTAPASNANTTILSGGSTTLLSGQNQGQTVYYYVIVQPTTAITLNTTLTLTFTAQ
ncbi:MAG TPA: hypothetical protein VKW09_03365 [bacterium]|nr:hypothetical protein [bacterium]